MNMNSSNFYQQDNEVEIVTLDGKRFLKKEPQVEEISKQMIKDAYEDILKNKPKQFGVGEFKTVHCENSCAPDLMIVHNRQTFCPICKRLLEVVGDANDHYDQVFQIWQGDKNFMEDILYGNKDAKLFVLDDEGLDLNEDWTEPEVKEL